MLNYKPYIRIGGSVIISVWEQNSMLIFLLGTKVPGDKSSWERRFQGTKIPEDESSTYGNESSRVQKFHEFLDWNAADELPLPSSVLCKYSCQLKFSLWLISWTALGWLPGSVAMVDVGVLGIISSPWAAHRLH